jgi:antitoxin component of MazEF toxin-antitoxin module
MPKKVAKAFKQGNSVALVIPTAIADQLEIGVGDFLLLSVKGKKLVVEKSVYENID